MTQPAGPWPDSAGGHILFLLDASNPVERRLLENWLGQTSKGSEAHTLADLPNKDPDDAKTKALSDCLGRHETAMVTPLRVVWLPPGKSDHRSPRVRDLVFGDLRRPGRLRANIIAKRSPERVQCIAGRPATLADLKERYAQFQSEGVDDAVGFAEFVNRQAELALDIAERRLQGTRYKVPRFVADELRASPKFNRALQDLSESSGQSTAQLHDEASVYMKEMIATPSTFWLDVMAKFNHVVRKQGYQSEMVYDQASVERIRGLVRENPAALLWTHKSHIDGLAMNSVLFENDFPAPHIMGGVNMAFAGFGFLARRSVAIFIRRTFQDNPLYKLVLRHYIGYLMDKRFPLSWAFEGTRSRIGKLMPPRFGLLKYVLEAAHATRARNLHVIPVTISYDLISDVADYAIEQSGIKKQPESLRWFIGYIKRLRSPMGRVYVDFGDPIVLNECPSPEEPLVLQKIAFEVAVRANAVTPLTLPSLVSMCLLGAAPQALTARELLAEIAPLVTWARARGLRMTREFDPDSAREFRDLSEIMISSGVFTRFDEGPEAVYGIAPDQHSVASYYRNSVIHFFVNKAIIELALVGAHDAEPGQSEVVFWSEVRRLRDLFKFEFFYAPTDEFLQKIALDLDSYDTDWKTLIAGGGEGIDQLYEAMQPLVSHATLLPFVEAYSVVADLAATWRPEQSLSLNDCVAQALKYGKQAYLQRRISSEASIGKLLFSNGYKLLENKHLIEPEVGDEDGLVQRRGDMAQSLRELSRRLDRIRAFAVVARQKRVQAAAAGRESHPNTVGGN